jgi:hypothetical protein
LGSGAAGLSNNGGGALGVGTRRKGILSSNRGNGEGRVCGGGGIGARKTFVRAIAWEAGVTLSSVRSVQIRPRYRAQVERKIGVEERN